MKDPLNLVASLALLLVAVLTVLVEIMDLPQLYWFSGVALLIYLANGARTLPWKARAFLIISAALVATVFVLLDDPIGALFKGVKSASFIATFFTALGFLRDAAHTSKMIRTAGVFLANQKAGRRYGALSLGGHLFALVLNYGSIVLLGAMAEKSTDREPDPLIRRLRLQRMLLAIQRGFISVLAWSPLTFSTVMTLTVIPNLQWSAMLPYCLVTSLLLIIVGWILDWIMKPPVQRKASLGDESLRGWFSVLPVVMLVAIIFGAALGLQEILQSRLVIAVVLSVPVVGIGWLMVQNYQQGLDRALPLLRRRLKRHVINYFPSYGSEITLLCSAGFIGNVAAALVPGLFGHDFIDFTIFPIWFLPVLCLWLIPIFGQLGMNPLLSVVVMGALLPDLAAINLNPVTLGVAFTAGWSMTGATSPFTATTMLVGRIAKVSPVRVGIVWNGLYSLILGVILTVWVVILSLVL